MGGLATKMARSMGFAQICPKKHTLSHFLTKPPISGLSNIYKNYSLIKMSHFTFIKFSQKSGP